MFGLFLEVFPIKGDKLKYTLNPTANIKKLNTDFRNFQKKYIQKAIDEDINRINKSKISGKFFEANKNKYISYSELKILYTNFAFNEYGLASIAFSKDSLACSLLSTLSAASAR